jgi:hypothetical protein
LTAVDLPVEVREVDRPDDWTEAELLPVEDRDFSIAEDELREDVP